MVVFQPALHSWHSISPCSSEPTAAAGYQSYARWIPEQLFVEAPLVITPVWIILPNCCLIIQGVLEPNLARNLGNGATGFNFLARPSNYWILARPRCGLGLENYCNYSRPKERIYPRGLTLFFQPYSDKPNYTSSLSLKIFTESRHK